MSILRQYVQTEQEIKNYTIDYSKWLDEGEFLDSVELTVTPDTPGFTVNVIVDELTKLILTVGPAESGSVGTTFNVSFLITDTCGQKKEDCLVFTIVNRCES